MPKRNKTEYTPRMLDAMTMRILCVLLAVIFLFAAVSGCTGQNIAETQMVPKSFSSFRDISGITDDEITAIETLKEQRDHFIYGMPLSTEAFIKENGEIGGFAALFCEWLTELLDIPFRPVNCEFADLIPALRTGEVDFTGHMVATAERKKIYFMTAPIVDRYLQYFRLADSVPLSVISQSRPLKLAMVGGSTTADIVFSVLEPDTFETVLIKYNTDAYDLLRSGEVDAFVHQNITETIFYGFNDIIAEDFYPFMSNQVSMTAQNPDFIPIISVVQKALANSDPWFISNMYSAGYDEFKIYKLHLMLTEDEKAYLHNHDTVIIAAEYMNYPVSFYNKHEKQWLGIYFDILSEVGRLTDLSFEIANDEHTEWTVLQGMLENGEVSIVDTLIQSEEREGRFIWPKTSFAQCNYVLISKTGYPNIKITDIAYLRVGVSKNAVYGELFKRWFPDHKYISEYDSTDDAITALGLGEVDVVMADEYKLLALTNYYEMSGYGINFVFPDQIQHTKFGFNKNETVLCSIIDKSLALIDANGIAQQWMRKTYDYDSKLARAQRPWLIGISVLAFCVIILMFVLMQIKDRDGKRLEKLVAERTGELGLQTSMLTAIFNSIPDHLFCKDMSHLFTRVNKSMEDFFNRHNSDIVGKNDIDGLRLSVDLAEKHEELESKVLKKNLTVKFEECLPNADGREVIFETIKTPLMQHGVITGFLGISRDITEHKTEEEAAINANRAKSEFLATMSHEIRTPLNAVIGLTDLTLENKTLDKETFTNLEKINNAGMVLLSIVNDILDISKIEAGKFEIISVVYDMPSLINDTVNQSIMHKGEKPVEFILNIDENLPSQLNGDELRIKQILNNLLSNAFKYTKEGTVELNISCSREDDTIWMIAYVRDTGIGIIPKNMKRLFDNYSQMDMRANREIMGTGLGLSIAKRLVELMNGTINVESEFGKGTIFTIRLPQGSVNDAVIGQEMVNNLKSFKYNEQKRRSNSELKRIRLPYAHILIVDDVTTNLDVAKGLMKPYGMQIDCVTSGQEAIDAIRDEKVRYNTVFMDHMMPGMDGIEATRLIREIGTDYATTVPIIALTANAVAGSKDLFLDRGFQAFISKPIDITHLDFIIRQWVRDEKQEEQYVTRQINVDGTIIPDTRSNRERRNPSDRRSGIDRRNLKKLNSDLDIDRGLERFGGDMKVYLDVMRSFAVNTKPMLEKIIEVNRENLAGYAITVHGIKGSSRGILAEAVGDKAEVLEKAAKDGDLDFISDNNPAFIETVEKLIANLENMLSKVEADNPKSKRDKPDEETLIKLLSACKNYDMDGANAVMAELEQYEYTLAGDLIIWLRGNVDVAAFKKIIEKLSYLD